MSMTSYLCILCIPLLLHYTLCARVYLWLHVIHCAYPYVTIHINPLHLYTVTSHATFCMLFMLHLTPTPKHHLTLLLLRARSSSVFICVDTYLLLLFNVLSRHTAHTSISPCMLVISSFITYCTQHHVWCSACMLRSLTPGRVTHTTLLVPWCGGLVCVHTSSSLSCYTNAVH